MKADIDMINKSKYQYLCKKNLFLYNNKKGEY